MPDYFAKRLMHQNSMTSVKNLRSRWEDKLVGSLREKEDGTLHTTVTTGSNSKSSGELSRQEMIEMFNASTPDLAMSFHGDDEEPSPSTTVEKNRRSQSLDDADNWTNSELQNQSFIIKESPLKKDHARRVLRVSATELGLEKGNLSTSAVPKAVRKWKNDGSPVNITREQVSGIPSTLRSRSKSRPRSKSPSTGSRRPSMSSALVNRRGRSKNRPRPPQNDADRPPKAVEPLQENRKSSLRIDIPEDGTKLSESFADIEKNPNLERLFSSATLDFDYDHNEEEATVYTRETVATTKTSATHKKRAKSSTHRTDGGRRRASLSNISEIPEESSKPRRRGSAFHDEAQPSRRSGSLVKRRSRRHIIKSGISMHDILQHESPQTTSMSQVSPKSDSLVKSPSQDPSGLKSSRRSSVRSPSSAESGKSKIRMTRSTSPARRRRASAGVSPSPTKIAAERRLTLSPSSPQIDIDIYAPFSEQILRMDSETFSPPQHSTLMLQPSSNESYQDASPSESMTKSRKITNILKDIVKTPKGKMKKSVVSSSLFKTKQRSPSQRNCPTIEERILDAGVTPEMYEKLLASGLMIVPCDR